MKTGNLASPPGARLSGHRPLIVCDADEVLFYFVRGLEAYLGRTGLYLDLKSFALTGNIKRTGVGDAIGPAEVKAVLAGFFESDTEHLEPVEGAAQALAALAAHSEIIVLSNLPEAQGAARRSALARAGMDYPLLTNSGPKGPVVKALAQARGTPTFFLDDLPPHIASVASEVPDATCIHFVADARLSALVETPPAAAHRGRSWADISAFIHARLG